MRAVRGLRREAPCGSVALVRTMGCCSAGGGAEPAPHQREAVETPLHANFGVELHGLSAADPGASTAIADALARHGLVLLRAQHLLTPQQQFDLVLRM
eukprot:COSAG02_NODE_30200_length_555_cov_1.236842_1_plen_97_part_01